MTDAAGLPGPLIGSGRAADVYALGDGRVLRRYRFAYSCAAEAGLMKYLREAGYPVPEVFAAAGTDLVMQQLHGRDMLADLASRPWRVARHARTLARLHDQLHQIAAPAGLRQFGSGGRVLHLDLMGTWQATATRALGAKLSVQSAGPVCQIDACPGLSTWMPWCREAGSGRRGWCRVTRTVDQGLTFTMRSGPRRQPPLPHGLRDTPGQVRAIPALVPVWVVVA